jgi:FMN phosphatase YigB (HAD superfamily)
MSITLLLDLDDTLLESNMDAFIPSYFKALSDSLADVVSPETMLPALMGGTKAMMLNLDPALTLREVFDAHFFPKLGVDRASLQERIDRFYDQVFPSLGNLTKPIPEAIRLVDWAIAKGHRVAIATNPLFPLKAIQHRLRWAGLPPEEYPFSLVTSYETFHFTKETVAYYPEVMAQLGWPDDPAVMVGDDIERDVKPTQAAGLPVFWVKNLKIDSESLTDIPQGPLKSFRGWLRKTGVDSLRFSIQTPQALLANLRSTPAALATLTLSLSTGTWTCQLIPGEWSLTEIFCHLRDVEREVNLPRIKRIFIEEDPFISGIASEQWAQLRNYAHQDGRQALFDFILARKEVLSLLNNLEGEWARKARHSIFGPTSLQELIGFSARHDRAHVQQVWKILHSEDSGQKR